MKKIEKEQELLKNIANEIENILETHKIPFSFVRAAAELETYTARLMRDGKSIMSGKLLMAIHVMGYDVVLKKRKGDPLKNKEYIKKYNNLKKYNSDAKRKSVERLTGKPVAERIPKKPKRRKKPKPRKRYIAPIRVVSQRDAVNNYTKEQDDIFGTS